MRSSKSARTIMPSAFAQKMADQINGTLWLVCRNLSTAVY